MTTGRDDETPEADGSHGFTERELTFISGSKPIDGGSIAGMLTSIGLTEDAFIFNERRIDPPITKKDDPIPTNDIETMAALRADTPLNRARAAFSGACGAIEQAGAQRRPASIIEIRRMEFEAVAKIAKALGVEIPSD